MQQVVKQIASIVTFLLLLVEHSSAQKEANNWYFGIRAGVDFNSGIPLALTDGQLSTNEGCATISDADGNLLFYTDGVSVWNKNHLMMSNGDSLNGHSSASQSAIIVPRPSSSNYYVFTVAQGGSLSGLQYSEVDMSMGNGLGDVTSTKNVQLVGRVLEKVAAVEHDNGEDYWVVTHEFNSDAFYAYLVTASGVSNSPEISRVGSNVISTITKPSFIGYMKISPNGTKLAMANGYLNVELFDFDAATGKVSNGMVLRNVEGTDASYGIEFSASTQVLYVADNQSGKVHQYDLESANIPASETVVFDIGAPNTLSAIQLGPDYKIYVARRSSATIDVIESPDSLGVACNYQEAALSLQGRSSMQGLPNFIASYFELPAAPPSPVDTIYPDIDFYNVFSPNGDGMNDLFLFETVNLNEMNITIYNRWGKTIFETTDLNNFWDGSANGAADAGEGTYYYTFDGVYKNEVLINKQGTITLVR